MKKQKNLSRLFPYAGKHKYLTIASLLFSGISAALALLPFVYIWFIIKEVLEVMPDFSQARNLAYHGWMAVIFAVASILVYLTGLMCSHISAFHVARNIRMKMVHHIRTLPLGVLDTIGSGKVRKIIDESSASTETYLAHQLPDLAGAIVTPVCMLVLLFLFDWRLGSVSLIPVALAFCIMKKMTGKGMADKMEEYQNALGDMNNEAVEYVRGISVVKTFGQTVFSFRRFQDSIGRYKRFVIAYTLQLRKPMLFFTVAINSVFAFLIPTALLVAGRGFTDPMFLKDLIFYIIFTPIIVVTLNRIMYASENGMIVSDALKRIDSIMELDPMTEPEVSVRPKDNSIELDRVTFRYPQSDSDALHNISLRVHSGQTIALVGPSGGGKTTVASLISRFWDATEGAVKIGGVNVKDIRKTDLMDTVSYVFQNNRLLKTSILENVRLSKPNATREEVHAALINAECGDILEKMPDGMDTVVGSKGVYLSGGECQRIAIARALLKDAPILILDEATAFVDPENEYKVQMAFEKLSQNKTILMIAHRLTTVKNADCIYVLKDGRIAESGKHEDLLQKDAVYARMWKDYQTSISWKVAKEVSA